MALSTKNKMGFVNETILKPEGPEAAKWERCNDMVLSWLLNSISPDIANSVIYADTTKEVWDVSTIVFLKDILLEYFKSSVLYALFSKNSHP